MTLLFSSFSVVSLNVRHIRDPHRRATLLPLLAGTDILLLQETHHADRIDTGPLFPISHFSAAHTGRGGVAILLSQRLSRVVTHKAVVLDYDDRALAVRLHLYDGRTIFCASLLRSAWLAGGATRRFSRACF